MNVTKFTKLTGTIVCTAILSLSSTMAHADDTLYKAFGGKEGIAKIVDDFVGITAADPRVNFQFAKTDIAGLKKLLNEQLCAATGGGCAYTGRDMKTAHAHMGVTNAQYNAIAENMYDAWDKNGIPYRVQNKVMAVLATMQRDIVTK